MQSEKLSVSQVAEELGVSERTTRRLIDSAALPAYRPAARTVWVRREDLDAYIEDSRIEVAKLH